MAQISNFGFVARLHSDASHHIIRYQNGHARQSGRGLSFWFIRQMASIAELPMDDREATLFVHGKSADFQDVHVQGALLWRIADPLQLAERIDFTIDLGNGQHIRQPLERIDTRLNGLVTQIILQYLAESPVRKLLDAGLEPVLTRLETALAKDEALTELGISVTSVRLTSLSPSSELERALQTPTFEALQQKADEAVFERRALAVEKERAIAENELANKVELARRAKLLIAEESQNARDRATSDAEVEQIGADAEASRVRTIEAARAAGEQAHIDVYRDIQPAVLLGLAAREFAGKLDSIEHLNVTPELLTGVMRELGQIKPKIPTE